jgi:Zn-dependent peptidase ImmA (M78 family)/DNA-binding XRE family transcriptional regulator
MARSVHALVNPDLLVWARRNSSLTIEQAAKKVPVKSERLELWEKGELKPTIKQLRKLGHIYKRPIALFYLSETPKDFTPLHDFRRFPGEAEEAESPQLRYEIRRARDRRDIALELFEALDGEIPAFEERCSLNDDPENLSLKIREILKVNIGAQFGFGTDYDALNNWREAIENRGVLIFQASGIDLMEMRGFSISEMPLPAIVTNIKDFPYGRIFTMLHEFVHILLGDGGLCDLTEKGNRSPSEERVEVFSNHVAGAALVPKDYLIFEDLVLDKEGDPIWSDDEILTLSKKYSVSREVLLRRLLIVGKPTPDFYRAKRRQFQKEYRRLSERQPDGFVPPYRKALSNAGPTFTRLVLNSYYQENITSSDLSDFLSVKLKHMGKIEREVMGVTAEFGAFS